MQRIGRAGHSVGEPSRGKLFPKHRGDLLEAAIVVRRMHDGLIESTRYLPQPARRARPSRSSPTSRWGSGRSPTSSPWFGGANFADAVRRAGQQRPRPARRALPERGVQRAAAPHRVGPGQRHPARPATGRAAPGRHQRRHHPRPRSVRRVPARRHPGRRARRGDGLRDPGPGETFILGASTWRIEDITFERVTVTPAPGEPGKDAVLARRPTRPTAGAGPGPRRVHPRDP